MTTETVKTTLPPAMVQPGYQFQAPVKRTQAKAPIILIHGLPGVGKSTFAASAPNPLFLFTENGQRDLNVRTLKEGYIESFDEMIAALNHVGMSLKKGEPAFKDIKTIVIDTVDHLEKQIFTAVADEYRKQAIADGLKVDPATIVTFADIPKIYDREKWGVITSKWEKLWGLLERLRDGYNITVIGLCHTAAQQVDDPTLDNAYVRYGLALDPKRAQTFWVDHADAIGYIGYEALLDKDTRRMNALDNPTLQFTRSARYVSKQNFGLGSYKLDKPAEAFMQTVGAALPFFAKLV